MAAPRQAARPERWLRLLLIFVPVAAIAAALAVPPALVFAFAALAIVPLAGTMGDATERLASRLGAGVGGLLNATFGNAAELIIALVALNRGLFYVVKASLTGSIIGNVLLVLGAAMLAGGARRERQRFDRSAALAGTTLLTLAAVGLLVPAIFHAVGSAAVGHAEISAARQAAHERGLSLEISIVLFIAYLLSLLFSLRTHRHLYVGRHGAPAPTGARPAGARPAGFPAGPAASAPAGSVPRAALTLLVATALVAWMSELLVGTIDGAARALGLTQVFVGVVVVAVIGNAAEHSTAVLMALKDKMDLAMSVAISSSIQIALFVAPALVFVSYFLPPGPMDLRFTPFEVLAVAVAVAVVNVVAQDGESNWLEGALMLAVYAILGIAFYFLP